jgi:branched-chain amino acid transport system substrate-binding protein
MNHAGVYSTIRAYLDAVARKKSDDGLQAVEEMKNGKIDDPLFANLKVRRDGRAVHDMYLAKVKTPTQSKKPWDYYEILSTIPADEAFKPLVDGNCPLDKN